MTERSLNSKLFAVFVGSILLSACNAELFEDKTEVNQETVDACQGATCSAPANATAACVDGECEWSCDSGFHVDDERNPTACISDNEVTSCGPTAADCTALAPPGSEATCLNGACGFSCNEGYQLSEDQTSCDKMCESDSECPAFSFGCIAGECKFPTETCGDAAVFDPCQGPEDAEGNPMAGYCIENPVNGAMLCVQACDPTGLRFDEACDEDSALCQPLGPIADIADASAVPAICKAAFASDADCPAGTFGLEGGVCVPPFGGAEICTFEGELCSTPGGMPGHCFRGAETDPLLCLATCDPSMTAQEQCRTYESGTVCQAVGAVGADDTFNVCIPRGTFTETAQCPSGTFGLVDDVCVPPSEEACDGLPIGTSCSFNYFDTVKIGACFGDGVGPASCVDECYPDQTIACDNPNSACQPSGILGDPATFGACIPSDTFETSDDCPTGTHGLRDGACVAPSVYPCLGADEADFTSTLGSPCEYDYFGDTMTGICFGDGTSVPACLASCSPAPTDGSEFVDCENGNSPCQAVGILGDPTTVEVCIPGYLGCQEDSDCLTGTHKCVEGACAPPSAIPCLNAEAAPESFFDETDPDRDTLEEATEAYYRSTDGSACQFEYLGESITGTCYGAGGPGACLANCDPVADVACANTNSVCQTVGILGDPTAVTVCIPSDLGCTVDSDCLSGTYSCLDGACVPPSATACANPDDLTDFTSTLGSTCSFSYMGQDFDGQCFGTGTEPPACLDTCEPGDNIACANTNSICQAVGILGDPTTVQVCIPDSSGCTIDSDCPTGTHACQNGACVPPSAIACANPDDPTDFTSTLGQPCAFEYLGVTTTGTCYGSGQAPAACLAVCDPEAGVGCSNANNICQAVGVMGDPSTPLVCIPADLGCTLDSDCPTGTYGCVDGACVAPSATACANPDDPTDFTSTLSRDCSFQYVDATYTGVCFGTGDAPPACLDECDPANGVECTNPNNVCQATGILGDPLTRHVCIPADSGCEVDSDCPSGTHGCLNGACVSPSMDACRDPGDPTNATSTLGFDCSFSYLGAEFTGTCFGDGVSVPSCLANCDPSPEDGSVGTGCSNSNSVCQATGSIGNAATSLVCIPAELGCVEDSDCPSGTHKCIDAACIPPSEYACANTNDPEDYTSFIGMGCSFTYLGAVVEGTCFGTGESPAACLAICDPGPVDGSDPVFCSNTNSICQAVGIMGDPATPLVCIPAELGCVEDDDCPTGTHYCADGACVAPSAVPCARAPLEDGSPDYTSMLGDECTFAYLDEVVTGTCFGTGDSPAACLANCDPGAGVDCQNGNNLCQAVGALGDPTTAQVCIPADSGCEEDADCPAGTHGCVDSICIPAAVGPEVVPDCYTDGGEVPVFESEAFLVDVEAPVAPDGAPTLDEAYYAGLDYSGCAWPTWAGDGYCDSANNNDACFFDGGDCCESSCTDGSYVCGGWSGTFPSCSDPNAVENWPLETVTQEVACVEDADCPDGADGCDDGKCVVLAQVGTEMTFGGPAVDGTECSYGYLDYTESGECFFDEGSGGSLCMPVCDSADPLGSCQMDGAFCQPFGVIDDPTSMVLCVPAGGFTAPETCPSGTFADDADGDGIYRCIPPKASPCVDPDDPANVSAMVGADCSYEYAGVALDGVCFGDGVSPALCVAKCDPVLQVGCDNPNSMCQASGIIGADDTFGACIPANTFTELDSCPTGTFRNDQEDGTFTCVAPSGIACLNDPANPDLGFVPNSTACSFSYFGEEHEGACFGADVIVGSDGIPVLGSDGHVMVSNACVDTCDPVTQTGCENPNSMCQATGSIGAEGTIGVCIPASTFTSAADCPSGTFALDQGDGTFTCTAPSGLGCLNDPANPALGFKPNNSACSYSYFGDTFEGVCFGADLVLDADGAPILGADGNVMVSNACVDTCDPVSQVGCDNPNSTCQATGIIGDPDTLGVCIPDSTFAESAAACPSGLFPYATGDVDSRLQPVFDCVAPSALGCLNDPTNSALGFVPNGSACSFSYFGVEFEGACFGADLVLDADGNPILGADGNVMVSSACVDTCDPVLQTGCANPNSTCQATGIVGDDATIGVCIPDTTFTESAAACPSGLFPVATGEVNAALKPTFNCVAPSGLACLNDATNPALGFAPNGSACSFSYFGEDLAGVCFGSDPVIGSDGLPVLGADGNVMVSNACVDTCDPVAQTGCANPNSTCQATGSIGDPATIGVCIPNTTFAASAAACPTGTHPVLTGEVDGSLQPTYNCVAPSAVACLSGAAATLDGAAAASDGSNVALDANGDAILGFVASGSACSYTYFGDSADGVCFGADPVLNSAGAPALLADGSVMLSAACVDTCDPVAQSGCTNPNSTCQATGIIGDPATIGVCIPNTSFASTAASCPTGTHPVLTGEFDGSLQPTYNCVAPSGIACLSGDAATTDGAALASDFSNLAVDANGDALPAFVANGTACSFDYFGDTVTGKCFGADPVVSASGAVAKLADGSTMISNACVATCSEDSDSGFVSYYTPGARPTCGNANSVCQPTGVIGDPDTFGACIPTSLSCIADAVPAGFEDAACPAGSFGCTEDGACLTPTAVDCITGYVCADPATQAPTATACDPAAGDDTTTCAAAALCLYPTFADTGTACGVDEDNDGVEELAGRCLKVPGDALGTSVCLASCDGLDGGSVTSCAAADIGSSATAYCQPLEARGQGLLTDLGDDGQANGSAGAPTPSDMAVCLDAGNACSAHADCDTATSIGCYGGICQTPSMNACEAGGVPGAAAATTACDSDGGGDNDGYCVPTTDTDADGVPDSYTACLKSCTPDGGAGTCATGNAACGDFTGADLADDGTINLSAGLFVCVPAP